MTTQRLTLASPTEVGAQYGLAPSEAYQASEKNSRQVFNRKSSNFGAFNSVDLCILAQNGRWGPLGEYQKLRGDLARATIGESGLSPIFFAVASGDRDTIDRLAEIYPSLDLQDANGNPLAVYATPEIREHMQQYATFRDVTEQTQEEYQVAGDAAQVPTATPATIAGAQVPFQVASHQIGATTPTDAEPTAVPMTAAAFWALLDEDIDPGRVREAVGEDGMAAIGGPDILGPRGYRPLHLAIFFYFRPGESETGDPQWRDVIVSLLKQGANPGLYDRNDKYRPIDYVVAEKDPELAGLIGGQLSLKREVREYNGPNFFWAIARNDTRFVRDCLGSNNGITVADLGTTPEGETVSALGWAFWYGAVETALFLLEEGCPIYPGEFNRIDAQHHEGLEFKNQRYTIRRAIQDELRRRGDRLTQVFDYPEDDVTSPKPNKRPPLLSGYSGEVSQYLIELDKNDVEKKRRE